MKKYRYFSWILEASQEVSLRVDLEVGPLDAPFLALALVYPPF